MPRKLSFLAGLGVLVAIGAAGSLVLDAVRPTGLVPVTFLEGRQPEPQEVTLRTVRTASLSRIFSVPVGPGQVLTQPASAKIATSGEVFVLDLGDRTVKRFDPTGTHLRDIARPQQSEMPLFTPTDFSLGPGEDVWITDNGPGTVVRYDRSGRRIDSSELGVTPYRIALFPDESLALMGFGEGAELIYLFERGGAPNRRFGKLIAEQEHARIALDGWIAPGGPDTLVFAGTYTSVLAKFSRQGELLFLRRPVDPHPDSSVEITESRRIHMVHGSPWSALSLAVDGDRFYVLTMDDDGERRKYLDAYSLDDGDYLGSFELPARCTAIDLRGSHLLTVTPDEMTLWNLEERGGQQV